jgi:hypothetical protein
MKMLMNSPKFKLLSWCGISWVHFRVHFGVHFKVHFRVHFRAVPAIKAAAWTTQVGPNI